MVGIKCDQSFSSGANSIEDPESITEELVATETIVTEAAPVIVVTDEIQEVIMGGTEEDVDGQPESAETEQVVDAKPEESLDENKVAESELSESVKVLGKVYLD